MKLYDLMQERNYSIRTLAKAADVGVSTIQRILNGFKGESYYAGPDVRRRICEILKVENPREIDEFALAIDYFRGKEAALTNQKADSAGTTTTVSVPPLTAAI